MLRGPRLLPMAGQHGKLLGEEGRELFPVEAQQILDLHGRARAASWFRYGGSPGRAHLALIAYADEAWQTSPDTPSSLLRRATRDRILGAGRVVPPGSVLGEPCWRR